MNSLSHHSLVKGLSLALGALNPNERGIDGLFREAAEELALDLTGLHLTTIAADMGHLIFQIVHIPDRFAIELRVVGDWKMISIVKPS